MAQHESVESRVRMALASWPGQWPAAGVEDIVRSLVEVVDEVADEAYQRGVTAGQLAEIDSAADRRAAALDADY